jgi:two-component system response regulator ChvI
MLCHMPSQPSGAAQTILVADDDDLLSEVLARALESYGYAVSSAPNGLISPELAVDVDLVVLDANIPGVDFAWALHFLRESDIAVLVLSGQQSPPPGVNEDEFLAKPVDLDRLIAAIRRLGSPASAV